MHLPPWFIYPSSVPRGRFCGTVQTCVKDAHENTRPANNNTLPTESVPCVVLRMIIQHSMSWSGVVMVRYSHVSCV